MKKIHIYIALLIVTVTFSSCREEYDEFETDRPTVAGFTLGATLELPVGSNGINNFPVPFFVSSASTSERVLNVVVIADETSVTADNYFFEETVVIPANERSGTLFFSAVNSSLSPEFEPLVIGFEEVSGVVRGTNANIALRAN